MIPEVKDAIFIYANRKLFIIYVYGRTTNEVANKITAKSKKHSTGSITKQDYETSRIRGKNN